MDSRRLELIEKMVRLALACQRGRSERWCLRLWGQFIKARDQHQCVLCGSEERIQAHHIFRRSLYPHGWYQPGNGITLCHDCHDIPHADFNGRPDLNQPVNAQGGDDLENVAYYFKELLEDADRQGLNHDEFYYFDDHMLEFFVRLQGYKGYLDAVRDGRISRLQMAYLIWRRSSENMLRALMDANFPGLLDNPNRVILSI